METFKVGRDIYELYELKTRVLRNYDELLKIDKKIYEDLHSMNCYAFYDLQNKEYGRTPEQQMDQKLWRFILFEQFDIGKYMLCTAYDKLQADINNYKFPVYTVENAENFLISMKALVYENIKNLVERVYDDITQGTYYTGGSSYCNSAKKKRNNNGIDEHFILTTHEYDQVFGYYSSRATITDDLEKACYLLDGRTVPDERIKEYMRKNQAPDQEGAYFRIKMCKNGNTHYWIKPEMRRKLNLYGSKKGIIGEDIKIKVFEKDN